MVKKIFVIASIPLLMYAGYEIFRSRRPVGCVIRHYPTFTMDTVWYGKFKETLPMTAEVLIDSSTHARSLKAEIDELYLSRVSPGMKAVLSGDNDAEFAIVTSKDTTIRNGRFEIELQVNDSASAQIDKKKSLRLRLCLSEPENVIQLSVGGFYKDSGGKYVYVAVNDQTVVRRKTILGRKNTESFEVLAGLTPGEVVVTSSYEWFGDRDTLQLDDIRKLYDDFR